MHRSLIGCAAALAAAGCPAARAADWYTGVETPAGPDAWIVAVDTSAAIASQGSQFASATVTAAPAGDLLTSGVRLRVDGLIGSYRAESPGAPARSASRPTSPRWPATPSSARTACSAATWAWPCAATRSRNPG
ncbi:hypothetical protein ACU4GR_25625 [Methylobacterium oryzae CBMB20]